MSPTSTPIIAKRRGHSEWANSNNIFLVQGEHNGDEDGKRDIRGGDDTVSYIQGPRDCQLVVPS